jgi:hypothetical protein
MEVPFLEVTMIIHQREIAYGHNYPDLFTALVKAKQYVENSYPEVSVELMYRLAGKRGRAVIMTKYPSLASYEKIDAELDKSDAYTELIQPIMGASEDSPVDMFYRVIEGS